MVIKKKTTKKKATKKKTAKKVVKKKNTKKTRQGMHPNSLRNLKIIKKGEIRNPLGAGAHDKDRKALKRLTHKMIKKLINLALTGTLEDLNAVAQNPRSSALEVGISSALANAIKKGDWSTLKGIVEALVGKEADKFIIEAQGEIEHKVINDGVINVHFTNVKPEKPKPNKDSES